MEIVHILLADNTISSDLFASKKHYLWKLLVKNVSNSSQQILFLFVGFGFLYSQNSRISMEVMDKLHFI